MSRCKVHGAWPQGWCVTHSQRSDKCPTPLWAIAGGCLFILALVTCQLWGYFHA